MNINIRKSVIDNFKDSNESEIKESINSSINEKDEITLPGLGVFFEILWSSSDDEHKNYIINTIMNSIKGNS
ncbi:MAG: small acid-soluble spore protein SspI [Clostridium sp.]|nr:small acid-soluble spore protein SspI [Clostridium sp.]MCM1444245.1 small acid-soluble spore protein SspI [Candidatus Amulumruptor caecigallinarius]